MIGFRASLLFSVLIHAALFRVLALNLWTPPEICFVPPQSTMTVQFSLSSFPAPIEENAVEAETSEVAAVPTPAVLPEPVTPTAPIASPPAVETSSAPKVEEKAKKEVSKPKSAPEKKKKARQTPPAKPADKAEKKEPPAQGSPVMQQSEPDKELVIGRGNAPSYARFLPPDYPPRARRQNIEGSVLLRVRVNKEGRAAEVQVVESSHPEFTRAAQKSVRRSRYVPMMYLGQPVEAWVLIPFHFKLR
ncbi:TonB family protein [Mailhella sp.]